MWHWAWKDSRAGSIRGTCGEGSDHCDCTQQRKCDHSKEAVLTVEKWGRSRRAEQRGEGGRERRGWREGIQERRGKRGGSKGGGGIVESNTRHGTTLSPTPCCSAADTECTPPHTYHTSVLGVFTVLYAHQASWKRSTTVAVATTDSSTDSAETEG